MSQLFLNIAGTTIAGSVIILFIVQKLKLWFVWKGRVVEVTAFVLGGLLGLLSHYAGWVAGPLLINIVQGLISALIAMGTYDVIYKKKTQ